jgi:hypothetical protein
MSFLTGEAADGLPAARSPLAPRLQPPQLFSGFLFRGAVVAGGRDGLIAHRPSEEALL